MSAVATAIIGSAVIGGVASNAAANSAADGANGAAGAANRLSQGQYNQQQWASKPWLEGGSNAMNQLSYLLGLGNPGDAHKTQSNFDANAYLAANPDAAEWIANNQREGRYLTAWDHYVADGSKRDGFWKSAPSANGGGGQLGEFGSLNRDFSAADFQADPGYQFRMDQGQKALERSASAGGRFLGGGTLKALTRYGQDMGSQEYDRAFGRFQTNRNTRFNQLAAVAGIGQTANAQLGQYGQWNASNQGNNLMGAATVAGNAGMASAAGWGSALNNGVNNWLTYKGQVRG